MRVEYQKGKVLNIDDKVAQSLDFIYLTSQLGDGVKVPAYKIIDLFKKLVGKDWDKVVKWSDGDYAKALEILGKALTSEYSTKPEVK